MKRKSWPSTSEWREGGYWDVRSMLGGDAVAPLLALAVSDGVMVKV